jgi:hypothetical protein
VLRFLLAVTGWLQQHPELVDQWRRYSADKRTSSGPYLGRTGQSVPLEVGYYSQDVGPLDVRHHSDVIDGCADFIYRETLWVLLEERIA